MKRSIQLAQQITETRKKISALAALENPTPEQEKEQLELVAKAKELEGQREKAIEREAALEENERRLAELGRGGERKTDPDDHDEPIVAKPAFLNDPKRGYKDLRAFLRS